MRSYYKRSPFMKGKPATTDCGENLVKSYFCHGDLNGQGPIEFTAMHKELAPLLQWLLIATNPIIWDFRQDMGCLVLIFGEATFLGHIKLGHKYQLNRAFAPLYVTNALCCGLGGVASQRSKSAPTLYKYRR